LPWALWSLTILILSLLPGDKFPEIDFALFEIDKLVHFTLYFILAILMYYSFFKIKNELLIKRIVVIIVTGVLFGAFIEIIQGTLITNRFFDQLDILANSLGTILGFIIIEKINLNKLKFW
jgi:VanZ family protein